MRVGAMLAIVLLLISAAAATAAWRASRVQAQQEVQRMAHRLAWLAEHRLSPLEVVMAEACPVAPRGVEGSASPLERFPDDERLRRAARPLVAGGDVVELGFLNSNGELLSRIGLRNDALTRLPSRLPGLERLHVLATGERLVGEPLATASAATLVPVVCRLNGTSTLPGATSWDAWAMVALIDVQALLRDAKAVLDEDSGDSALLRADGLILATDKSGLDWKLRLRAMGWFAMAPEADAVNAWSPDSFAGHVLAAHKLPGWPWLAAVDVPVAQTTAWRDALWAVVAGLAAPGALLVIGMFWLAAHLAKRARGLSEHLDMAQARWRSLVESSPDGIVLAEDGRIVYANPAMLSLVRVAEGQGVLGRRVDELLDGLGPYHPSDEFDGPAPSSVVRVEHFLRPLSGEALEVETLIAPAPLAGDRMLQIVVRDITGRKQAERALRESDERYRVITESAPDITYLLTDAEGVIRDISPRKSVGLLGQPDALLGRPLAVLFADSPTEAGASPDQRMLSRSRASATEASAPQAQGGATITGPSVPHPRAASRQFEGLLARMRHGASRTEADGWIRRSDGTRFWAQVVVSSLGPGRVQGVWPPDGAATLRYHVQVRDMEARRQMQHQLDLARRKAESLALASEGAREAEKRRIARELHDELGQVLTVQQMAAEMLAQDAAGIWPEGAERLSTLRTGIDDAISVTRRIAGDLRPLVLDDLGLAAALDWLVSEVRLRAGIRTDLHIEGQLEQVPDPMATALFRIAQECLTNVMRHAGAKRVSVHLTVEDSHACLRVQDDGRGMPQLERRRGLGLSGMQERARLLGGDLTISSNPDAMGTCVEVRLPLAQTVTTTQEKGDEG
jgi:PAS domain S-box-containing protein